jgi:hypothetical protein
VVVTVIALHVLVLGHGSPGVTLLQSDIQWLVGGSFVALLVQAAAAEAGIRFTTTSQRDAERPEFQRRSEDEFKSVGTGVNPVGGSGPDPPPS